MTMQEDNLGEIYRHRDKYTVTKIPKPKNKEIKDKKILSDFRNYAHERMQIRQKKETKQAQPRTQDTILQTYKFCNVYRELDKQTRYIHTKLAPLRDDFPLRLINLMIFRFTANLETFEKVGLYTEEDKTYEKRLRQISGTKFGDAYLFPPQVPVMLGYHDRIDFMVKYLPSILPKLVEVIQRFSDTGIYEGVDQIMETLGINMRFHFTEILIDTAYQYPHLLNLNKKFYIGPGALPTLKKFNNKKSPEQVCLDLIATQPQDFPFLEIQDKIMPITAEGIEGLCCEFRKYSNLKIGKGKRRKYKTRNNEL